MDWKSFFDRLGMNGTRWQWRMMKWERNLRSIMGRLRDAQSQGIPECSARNVSFPIHRAGILGSGRNGRIRDAGFRIRERRDPLFVLLARHHSLLLHDWRSHLLINPAAASWDRGTCRFR